MNRARNWMRRVKFKKKKKTKTNCYISKDTEKIPGIYTSGRTNLIIIYSTDFQSSVGTYSLQVKI